MRNEEKEETTCTYVGMSGAGKAPPCGLPGGMGGAPPPGRLGMAGAGRPELGGGGGARDPKEPGNECVNHVFFKKLKIIL